MTRKVFKILTKTVIVLAVVTGLGIFSLKILGRSGAPLKEGIENFMSETSGMKAHIGELSQSEFFPDVHISMQDIDFFDPRDAENRQMKIDSLSFSIPFYTFLLGNHAAEFFSLKGLEAQEEALTPHALTLDKGTIEVEKETQVPYFSFSGQYAGKPLLARVGAVSRSNYNGKTLYRISDISTIFLTIGDIMLEGTLRGSENGPVLGEAVMKSKTGATPEKSWGPETIGIKREDNLFSCLFETAGDLKQTEKQCTKYFKDSNTK
ncbi:MAG: hypothetical protein H6853_03410 [Rhodospirillales bacterium]|nr:hypothetical protein [Alphaproteobacteria bacterium]USO04331.1 MAG: hypothetical protein H6853_03410 [Rhodospirillales bacterium]